MRVIPFSMAASSTFDSHDDFWGALGRDQPARLATSRMPAILYPKRPDASRHTSTVIEASTGVLVLRPGVGGSSGGTFLGGTSASDDRPARTRRRRRSSG